MGDSESGSYIALRRSSRLLGPNVPQRGSLYGLRRSLRIHSKSQSCQMPLSCKKRKQRKPKPKPPLLWIEPGEIYFRGGFFSMVKRLRYQRMRNARIFKSAYSHKSETSDRWDKITENRFIVVSGEGSEEHAFPNVGRSHGILWVGVHGGDSICAVFLNKKPDMKRIIDKLGDSFTTVFMQYVLSEMEGIADSPPYSDKIGGKPFAVVSLPDYSYADEESGNEASAPSIDAQEKTIAHLKKEMISDSEYTRHEIEKIAISAFQLLCGQKFEAEDIKVCVFLDDEDDYEILYLQTSKIRRRLAAINRGSKSE